MLLVTAHLAQAGYLGSIVQLQFKQEFSLLPSLVRPSSALTTSLNSALTVLRIRRTADQGWSRDVSPNLRPGRKQLASTSLGGQADGTGCVGDPQQSAQWPRHFSTEPVRRSHRCADATGTWYDISVRPTRQPFAQVIHKLLGSVYEKLPTMKGRRGLIILACGYALTNVAQAVEIKALVTEYVAVTRSPLVYNAKDALQQCIRLRCRAGRWGRGTPACGTSSCHVRTQNLRRA